MWGSCLISVHVPSPLRTAGAAELCSLLDHWPLCQSLCSFSRMLGFLLHQQSASNPRGARQLGEYPCNQDRLILREGRCVTCAQDSDSRSHIVGRHVPGIQLSMQIRQLVCSVSACIALPCSYLQDAPHLRDDPCLQGEPTEEHQQEMIAGGMFPRPRSPFSTPGDRERHRLVCPASQPVFVVMQYLT